MQHNVTRGGWLVGLAMAVVLCGGWGVAQARPLHPWLGGKRVAKRSWLLHRVAPPRGFRRVKVRKGSFAWWLRRLPMAPTGTPIRDYRGRVLADQAHRAGVFRLDVGRGNLQQCADVVMRLWGEYLWHRGLQRWMQFRLTSGHRNPWRRWARGDRLRIVRGRMRGWRRRARRPNRSYRSFRRYMRVVMMYSGTASLSRELKGIPRRQARAGDLLLQGGFPGHVVLLLDEAKDRKGRSIFLVGQGFMPAQSFHLVRSGQGARSPWFAFPVRGPIATPSWRYARPRFFRLPHRRQTR